VHRLRQLCRLLRSHRPVLGALTDPPPAQIASLLSFSHLLISLCFSALARCLPLLSQPPRSRHALSLLSGCIAGLAQC
jgi:hypothetical protein